MQRKRLRRNQFYAPAEGQVIDCDINENEMEWCEMENRGIRYSRGNQLAYNR